MIHVTSLQTSTKSGEFLSFILLICIYIDYIYIIFLISCRNKMHFMCMWQTSKGRALCRWCVWSLSGRECRNTFSCRDIFPPSLEARHRFSTWDLPIIHACRWILYVKRTVEQHQIQTCTDDVIRECTRLSVIHPGGWRGSWTPLTVEGVMIHLLMPWYTFPCVLSAGRNASDASDASWSQMWTKPKGR